MRIEKIQTSNLHHVASLAHAIWPVVYAEMISADQLTYMLEQIYSNESLTHQMQDLNHQFILAWDEHEKPIAFASFAFYNQNDLKFVKLHKLYVLPDLHKSGIGRSLLHFIETEMKNEGYAALRLNVNRNNFAIGFYQRHGFSIIKEEDIAIGNGFFMNDYVMKKEI
jgi:ribosomal protein S18 acetylase RimI-like enzyme